MKKVMVLVSCYRRLAFTKLCLPLAIKHAGMEASWHLVDDASPDGTGKFLNSLRGPNVEINHSKKNQGFAYWRNFYFRKSLEEGFDFIANVDNDLLMPPNWLRDIVSAFDGSGFGVGTPWVVNDKTIDADIARALKVDSLCGLDLDCWVDTETCGGTCAIHNTDVFRANCFYDVSRPRFSYQDSLFNGKVRRAGFKIGVYLGVPVWCLQSMFWPDPDYEADKLRIRHKYRGNSSDSFRASLQALKSRVALGVADPGG